MIDKNRVQELQYLMHFYHINKIPLFHGRSYCGELTDSLEYTDTYYAPCKFTDKQCAIECACDEIHDIIDVVKGWNKNIKVNVDFVDNSWGWIYKDDGRVDHYGQKNEVKSYVWEGTFDKVCERYNKANNSLKYCNGKAYQFKDEDMGKKYLYWVHLIPFSRSFELCYPGNTVVD